jgi:hypothetical protein
VFIVKIILLLKNIGGRVDKKVYSIIVTNPLI